MAAIRSSRALARRGWPVCVCLMTDVADGAGARPREGRRHVQVEPGRRLPERGRVAGRRRRRSPPSCRRCAKFQGQLGSSPPALADALELMSRLDKELSRLYVYASMLADQDTRVSEPQGMQQEMQQIYANFGAQASFIEPEMLRVGSATIEKFIAAEPRLKPYAFYLRDIVRRAAHTLTRRRGEDPRRRRRRWPARRRTSTASWPTPTSRIRRSRSSDGKTVKVDQAGYSELRTSPNREDRKAAMSAFFGALGGFGRTFGTTMNSSVQKSLFYARSRKYASNLEAALNGPNIPVSVYMRLVDGVNRHLPTFHRYLRLRKRMMGHHRRPALLRPVRAARRVGGSALHAGRGAGARDRAMAPLGADYTGVLQRAFKERWLDWYPDRRQGVGRLLERRRLRRAPVHAAELPRAVQRRQHAGPRAGPHDAQLLLEQDAAVRRRPATRRSSPRSRPRSTRRCSSITC